MDVEPARERHDHAKRAEDHDDDGGGIDEIQPPAGEVGETEGEFDEGVKETVGAHAFGEQVVHVKTVGEARKIEKFEHREAHQKQSHEVVHPGARVGGGTVGDGFGPGGEGGKGEEDEQGQVVGPGFLAGVGGMSV